MRMRMRMSTIFFHFHLSEYNNGIKIKPRPVMLTHTKCRTARPKENSIDSKI